MYNAGHRETAQVRVGGSDSKPHGNFLVSEFSVRMILNLGEFLTVQDFFNIVLGAKVTAHYNTNATSLDGLIDEFGADKIQKVQADLGNEDEVVRMFGEIVLSGRFGIVQVIIVNHAIYVEEDVPMVQMSLGQWNKTINANLTSSFLVIKQYLLWLAGLEEEWRGLKDEAAIVLVGSTAGKYGKAGHADYSATKSGKTVVSDDSAGWS